MQQIALGYRCNNACAFCAPGGLRQLEPETDAKQVLEQIARLSAGQRVAFVGGEPTLFDELPHWAVLARQRGVVSVLVQTNARKLALKGYAGALAESGIDVLDVSLHGASEAMHDYHTRAPGSFRQTIAGMRRARAARMTLGITTVVTRSNYRHLSEIIHVAHTLGARAVHLATLALVGSARDNALQLQPAAPLLVPHLRRAEARAASLGLVVVTTENLGNPGVPPLFAGMGRHAEDSATQP
ncbi:MAG: radical SAM protein [Polyangiaceae bacterium]